MTTKGLSKLQINRFYCTITGYPDLSGPAIYKDLHYFYSAPYSNNSFYGSFLSLQSCIDGEKKGIQLS